MRMQSAYDDYADKIKEQLKELETSPGNVLEQLEPACLAFALLGRRGLRGPRAAVGVAPVRCT